MRRGTDRGRAKVNRKFISVLNVERKSKRRTRERILKPTCANSTAGEETLDLKYRTKTFSHNFIGWVLDKLCLSLPVQSHGIKTGVPMAVKKRVAVFAQALAPFVASL